MAPASAHLLRPPTTETETETETETGRRQAYNRRAHPSPLDLR